MSRSTLDSPRHEAALSPWDMLAGEALAHPAVTHPFWERFAASPPPLPGLEELSLHYYRHVQHTRLYLARLLSRCPTEEIQFALAQILADEYGRGNPKMTHPAQFRRLLSALEILPDAAPRHPLPELDAYIAVHFHLCGEGSLAVGFGVVGIAMEAPIPTLYRSLVAGYRKAGISLGALEFFTDHIEVDLGHAAIMADALSPLLDRPTDRALIRHGMLRSLDARKLFMDGLFRVTFG